MFKIMLFASVVRNLSKAEYMINDRRSFQRFLGLTLGDKVPDAKTIWLFRDKLSKNGADQKLFAFFTAKMEDKA